MSGSGLPGSTSVTTIQEKNTSGKDLGGVGSCAIEAQHRAVKIRNSRSISSYFSFATNLERAQKMSLNVQTILSGLVGLEHVYIFFLESFMWGTKKFNVTFGIRSQEAESLKQTKHDQLYVLFGTRKHQPPKSFS